MGTSTAIQGIRVFDLPVQNTSYVALDQGTLSTAVLPWVHGSRIPSLGITLARELSGPGLQPRPRAARVQCLVPVGGCTGPTCLPQFGATLKDFPAPGPSLGRAEAWLQPHHSSTLPVTCPTLLLSFTADVSRPNSQETPSTQIFCF